jgi:hypothetical protein
VEGWRLADTFLSCRVDDLKSVHRFFGVDINDPHYTSAFRPGYGYGIICEMPFQCVIGRYERETVAEPSSTAGEM